MTYIRHFESRIHAFRNIIALESRLYIYIIAHLVGSGFFYVAYVHRGKGGRRKGEKGALCQFI